MPEPSSKGHLNPGARGVAFDRFELGPGLGELVRHVWVVRWSLPHGVVLPQRVLGYPAVNVVLQPGGTVIAGPDPRLSERRLEGDGWAVGVLFRPAAAALLAPGLLPAELVGAELPFSGAPDRVVAELMASGASAAHERVGAAAAGAAAMDAATTAAARQGLVEVLRRWLLPVSAGVDDRGRLVNEVCRLAEEDPALLRSAELAERAGLSLRSLERLTVERVGVTPKWLIECRRLQEAATRLFGHPETELSVLAAELGYSDYPHFSRRYAAVLGETPAATRVAGSAAGAHC